MGPVTDERRRGGDRCGWIRRETGVGCMCIGGIHLHQNGREVNKGIRLGWVLRVVSIYKGADCGKIFFK